MVHVEARDGQRLEADREHQQHDHHQLVALSEVEHTEQRSGDQESYQIQRVINYILLLSLFPFPSNSSTG